jgi:hypothetical protein
MYIIHETLASNDPRIHPKSSIVGDYWHFTIRYIPPNKGIFIDWLPHEKISEEAAYACKLAGAYKGVVSLAKQVTKVKDIVGSSGDVEWKKYIYVLTKTDKANVVLLIKAAMRLYAQAHLQDQKSLKKLINEVNSVDTIEQGQHILYHYYNVGSALTNGLPKEPKFKVAWPEEKK